MADQNPNAWPKPPATSRPTAPDVEESRLGALKISQEESGHGPSGPEESVVASSITQQKVAAAKQYIENHYRTQMKSLQERKERSVIIILTLLILFLVVLCMSKR